jgi:hypothetical protein
MSFNKFMGMVDIYRTQSNLRDPIYLLPRSHTGITPVNLAGRSNSGRRLPESRVKRDATPLINNSYSAWRNAFPSNSA